MIPIGMTPIRTPSECRPSSGRVWTLLEWISVPGVGVRTGETIAWLGCSDSTLALHSPVSGRMSEHWVEEGSTVDGGQVVALIESESG